MLSADSPFSSPDACGHAAALRDYAFDELPAAERPAMEEHINACSHCAVELERLRLTTAALRILPDREIPQRIAFISDQVFRPSIFARFWNSGARLGFASACVLAAAILISAWHISAVYRPAAVQTVAAASPAAAQVNANQINAAQIDAAVAKAVAQARAEDARMIQAAVRTADRKREAEYRSQMVALEESFEVLRKRLNMSYMSLASNELTGAGQ
ncbi:MAG TPA: hypothetical protein VHC72_01390 [Bryobacteraceae bacterium]|nr:hypothetical protein [Bryobacteraceae bacterium]